MATETAVPRRGKRRRDVRPRPGARRLGYVIAIALNLLFLYLVHRRPGWDVVPILTDDTTRVLAFVDASIVASIAVNVVLLVRDPRAVKALGDITTSVFSLVAMIRIWQVWPFDFSGVWGGWRLLIQLGLGVGIFGVVVGIIAALAVLIRQLVAARPPSGEDRA